jgi:hypothetical protein
VSTCHNKKTEESCRYGASLRNKTRSSATGWLMHTKLAGLSKISPARALSDVRLYSCACLLACLLSASRAAAAAEKINNRRRGASGKFKSGLCFVKSQVSMGKFTNIRDLGIKILCANYFGSTFQKLECGHSCGKTCP